MKKKVKKIVIAVLVAAICGACYAIMRPLGVAERGSTAFGGEILFITFVPVVIYLAARCIHDSVNDFKKKVKEDDAHERAVNSAGRRLLYGHLRDGE